MNIFIGLALIAMLVILHVLLRRVRKLEEMLIGDNDKIKNSLVKIGEWMVYFDIGLTNMLDSLGAKEEGSSLDEHLKELERERDVEKDASGQPFRMIIPNIIFNNTIEEDEEPVEETYAETIERISSPETLSGLEEEDEIIDLIDEIKEPVESEAPEGYVKEQIDEHTVRFRREQPHEKKGFTIPNLEFKGDWRETDAYIEMRDQQEGC